MYASCNLNPLWRPTMRTSASRQTTLPPIQLAPELVPLRADFYCHPQTLAVSPLKSGGTRVLEKPKLHLDPVTPLRNQSSMFVPETDDGDGGGDDGGSIGGGDQGGGGGDDDQYHPIPNDDGDGDPEQGIFKRRLILPEIYKREIVNAVMSEWMKIVNDLPSGFRLAYELGVLSSAQFTRFLCFHCWPTLPPHLSYVLNGRIIADPAFFQKFILQTVASACSYVWTEFENRGKDLETFKRDLLGILTKAVFRGGLRSGFLFFILAPCNSPAFPKPLPNNIFEMNYKCRSFGLHERVLSFFAQSVKLCVFEVMATTAELAVFPDTISDPTLKGRLLYTLRNGIYYCLVSNLMGQLQCGIDIAFAEKLDRMLVANLFGSTLRVLSPWVEETQLSKIDWKAKVFSMTGLVKPNNKCRRRHRRSIMEESRRKFPVMLMSGGTH